MPPEASPPPPLLVVRDLRKEFESRGGFLGHLLGRRREIVRAVDGVSFDLQPGEILGLVGESGSGKTTLGRLIVGLEDSTSGTVHFDGQDVAWIKRRDVRRLRRDVQIIFQNPYEAMDPRYTIGAWLSEPLTLLGIGTLAERRRRVLDVLHAVELRPARDYVHRFPNELSGGQRQRVGIARAAVVEPRLMVADEPVSMLDVSVRSGIMNLMLTLREHLGVAYVFITHDLAVARYMCDRIAVMYLGKIVEVAPTDQIISRPAHPYTKLLLAAVPEAERGRKRERVRLKGEAAAVTELPSGCRFHPRCPLAQARCVAEEPRLVDVARGGQAACHFSGDVLRMDRLPTG
jgi:peptide/nickel transport system ATP-binding protein